MMRAENTLPTAMNDKSALLSQLKIERSDTPPAPTRAPWVVLALLLAAAGGAWALFGGEKLPEVRTVTARALTASSGPGSVLDASGYVVARRQATVSSKLTGKVTEVLIEEGQRVAEGEVLARIDDTNARAQSQLAQSQLDAARAQLAEVRVQLEEAERQLLRTRELAEKKLLSQQALDTAQANRDAAVARLASTQSSVVVAERSLAVQQRLLEDTVVRAPFAGVITVKNAQPGEMISPLSAGGAGTRTGIGTLVDMESLEVEVDVNENFINRVQPGQPVSAKLNAYPEWAIPAEVVAVIPAADRSKATVKVRVGFKEKDPRILPDMGVRVSFLTETKTASADAPRGVLIAKDALHAGAVFILRDDTLERRAVKVEGTVGDELRVVAGLSGGEVLAIGDYTQLADGIKVKIQPQDAN